MNGKIVLSLILFTAFAFAQGSSESIRNALCDMVDTSQTFLAVGIMFFVILAIPVLALGIFLYVKKKEMRNTGIILILLGILIPLVMVVIYLLMPWVVSSLTGVNMQEMGCG